MKNGRLGKYQRRYNEAEPDVTSTGVGKNYDGFRIFHTRKSGRIDLIKEDYSLREPKESELERFRQDLQRAAARDRKVARYLAEFPELGRSPVKSEPETEGIIKSG